METKLKEMQINMLEEQQLFAKHILKQSEQGEKLSKKMKLGMLFGIVCGCGFMMMVSSLYQKLLQGLYLYSFGGVCARLVFAWLLDSL